MNLLNKLDGKKVHILAGIKILTIIGGYLTQSGVSLQNIPEIFASIWPMLLIMAGRDAIRKVEKKQ